jgi:hypothetical protein
MGLEAQEKLLLLEASESTSLVGLDAVTGGAASPVASRAGPRSGAGTSALISLSHGDALRSRDMDRARQCTDALRGVRSRPRVVIAPGVEIRERGQGERPDLAVVEELVGGNHGPARPAELELRVAHAPTPTGAGSRGGRARG